MLKESQLFALLDKVLNQTSYIRKGEEAVYFCPFCTHYKKKLEVNVRTQEWHCWICNACGKSIRSLFYKLKTKESYFDELYKILGTSWTKSDNSAPKLFYPTLPNEFIPLSNKSKNEEYGLSMAYLQDRNVTMDDIIRYNIGYCAEGQYKNRVIIPSYDKNADVNFFAARSFNEGAYKYMLPSWPKDIVGFELFVNWNEPITLCEGTFDGVAIRNNAIPLFGTTLTFALKMAIVANKVKRVNIVLDNDALKQAIDIFDRIEDMQVNHIDIHLIRLGEKDPSILGFDAVTDIINNSKPFDFTDIIKTRLDLL